MKARAARAATALSILFAASFAIADAPVLTWRSETRSPNPRPADAREASLYSMCGPADAALVDAASHNVESELAKNALLPADELAFSLRAEGDPHVWPRSWSISGAPIDDAEIATKLRGWLDGWKTLGKRRCGIARATASDGTPVVVAVAYDALADMAPLPTTARVGQWLTLNASLLVSATDAQVVLLGPRGAPKTVLASLSGRTVRSSFAFDQRGMWLVQVLATVSTGPRPVLEAIVFADATPPTRYVRTTAPGEDAAKGAKDDADAVLRMVNAARAAERLPALTRDPALDRLARDHSDEMLRAGLIGHDVGGGDPRARLEAAHIHARIAGENVASATSLENAHRALWASPSHRGNLLFDRFARIGVGVVRGANGVVWVTELFAG